MTTEIETVKTPQEYLPAEQMKEISTSLADAKQKAVSIRVVSDESMDEANGLCGGWRAKQKNIETFRLAIVKPFKDHIAKIDKFFKDLAGGYDEPLEIASDKVLKFRQKKIEAARKEQEKIDAAAAQGKKIEPKKEAPAKSSFQEGVGRTTFIKTATHEVKALDLVPEEFWCIDEKKLGARVRELTKDLEVGKTYDKLIPGVLITCTERPSYAGEK